MNNPLWHWLVESDTTAYFTNEHFDGPSSYDGNPLWESQRFGQSITTLPDGREILIAGEHEDYYDPDFFIYNDIIIRHPDGRIDFLAYPVDIFPPTDFHSATLIGEKIIVVGNLGYPDDRKPGTIQILIVDTNTWKISIQSSAGDSPGWIHEHEATLSQDQNSITISGGSIVPEDLEKPIIENIDDWQLQLEDWRWERLTERNWTIFEIKRVDGKRNQLWELRQGLWEQQNPGMLRRKQDYPIPDDPSLLETLYSPELIPHRPIPENEEEEEYNVHRIEIEGICVRYVEDHFNIMVTVEGDLSPEMVTAVLDDLISKLSKLEETEYHQVQCRP